MIKLKNLDCKNVGLLILAAFCGSINHITCEVPDLITRLQQGRVALAEAIYNAAGCIENQTQKYFIDNRPYKMAAALRAELLDITSNHNDLEYLHPSDRSSIQEVVKVDITNLEGAVELHDKLRSYEHRAFTYWKNYGNPEAHYQQALAKTSNWSTICYKPRQFEIKP